MELDGTNRSIGKSSSLRMSRHKQIRIRRVVIEVGPVRVFIWPTPAVLPSYLIDWKGCCGCTERI